MGASCVTRVYEQSEATLSDRLVILAVADAADKRGIAYPLVETVAEMARVSERTAHNAIRDLVEAGELAVVTAYGRGRRNVFVVLVGLSQEQREASLEAARAMAGKGAKSAPIIRTKGANPAPISEAGKGAKSAPIPAEMGAKCDKERVQSATSQASPL